MLQYSYLYFFINSGAKIHIISDICKEMEEFFDYFSKTPPSPLNLKRGSTSLLNPLSSEERT